MISIMSRQDDLRMSSRARWRRYLPALAVLLALPGAHAARGLSQSVSQAFTVLALGLMPLSSTIAINFSAPLWAALISVIWLRERPGPQRLAFLGVGFIGV